MKLQESINFFESLKNKTTKKSESKIYSKFIQILKNLKDREFSKDEIQSIETELDKLNFKSNEAITDKQYSKLLKEFSKFLKDKFSLISQKHYTNIGLSVGIGFGVVAGILIGERSEKSLGIAVGISLGMLIGLFIGNQMDTKAKKENRVI
jgi:ElaB/YqjD/DUF883 family membrane-anchored ribosome-binding protein